MNTLRFNRFSIYFLFSLFFVFFPEYLFSTVEDAVGVLYDISVPFYKQGFAIRKQLWGGDLGLQERKALTLQLFKGNKYLFLLSTDIKGAILAVHVYNENGKLVDNERWQKGKSTGTIVIPSFTGTYFVIVQILKSPESRTTWAMVYGYK